MIYFFSILGFAILVFVLSWVDLERQLHKYDEEMKKQEKKSQED